MRGVGPDFPAILLSLVTSVVKLAKPRILYEKPQPKYRKSDVLFDTRAWTCQEKRPRTRPGRAPRGSSLGSKAPAGLLQLALLAQCDLFAQREAAAGCALHALSPPPLPGPCAAPRTVPSHPDPFLPRLVILQHGLLRGLVAGELLHQRRLQLRRSERPSGGGGGGIRSAVLRALGRRQGEQSAFGGVGVPHHKQVLAPRVRRHPAGGPGARMGRMGAEVGLAFQRLSRGTLSQTLAFGWRKLPGLCLPFAPCP
eukprot:gene5671-biopygen22259